jgi:hypothetical protein
MKAVLQNAVSTIDKAIVVKLGGLAEAAKVLNVLELDFDKESNNRQRYEHFTHPQSALFVSDSETEKYYHRLWEGDYVFFYTYTGTPLIRFWTVLKSGKFDDECRRLHLTAPNSPLIENTPFFLTNKAVSTYSVIQFDSSDFDESFSAICDGIRQFLKTCIPEQFYDFAVSKVKDELPVGYIINKVDMKTQPVMFHQYIVCLDAVTEYELQNKKFEIYHRKAFFEKFNITNITNKGEE